MITQECPPQKPFPAVVLSVLMGCAAVALFVAVVVSVTTQAQTFCRITTISSCAVNLLFNLFWFRCTKETEEPDTSSLWNRVNAVMAVASVAMLALAIIDIPFVYIQIGGAILAGVSLAFVIRWVCKDSVAGDCIGFDAMDLEAQVTADPTTPSSSVHMQALMHPKLESAQKAHVS